MIKLRRMLPQARRSLWLLLALSTLSAQTIPDVEITAEPHHHLTLQNESVRVFTVDVPPHADTLMHWHRHDYLFVTLGATEVVNAVKGKPPVTLKLQDGETHLVPTGFAHIARNLSNQSFRNVTIELLQDEKLRQLEKEGHAKWDETRGLEILPGGTKQILFVKDGVRVTEFELQPGGAIPPTLHAAPQLLVAISNLEIRTNAKPHPSTHLNSGDTIWLPANHSRTLTNAAPRAAKFVTLEFP
jgi:quercetin dioxygenase-like cupin family protein